MLGEPLNTAENKLQERMLAARQNFESSLVTQFVQINSSKIYKYLSTFTGSCSIPNVMSQEFDNDDSISNGFNQYFHSVFTHESSGDITPPSMILH